MLHCGGDVARNKRILNMPSNTGRTAKRVTSKAPKVAMRSVPHRTSTLAWLSGDPAHAAALLDVALETGDAGDVVAALQIINSY